MYSNVIFLFEGNSHAMASIGEPALKRKLGDKTNEVSELGTRKHTAARSSEGEPVRKGSQQWNKGVVTHVNEPANDLAGESYNYAVGSSSTVNMLSLVLGTMRKRTMTTLAATETSY